MNDGSKEKVSIKKVPYSGGKAVDIRLKLPAHTISDKNKVVDVHKSPSGAPAQTFPIKKGNRDISQTPFIPNPNSPHHKQRNKKIFLEKFALHATISDACKASGIERHTVLRWRKSDALFAQAFDTVNLAITDDLEGYALDRAKSGSDLLTIFLLKARNPERFNDKYMQGIDAKMVENLVNRIVNALKKTVPEYCPHCKTSLGLTDKVANMLAKLSQEMPK